MEDRLAELRSEKFTLERVAAHIPEFDGARPLSATNEVVWSKGTGRLTIRYVFPQGVIVYGKFFDDELGPRAFAGLRALRQEGFGAGSEYQVAEPLHFDERWNMLLLRQAEGVQLSDSLDHAPLEEAVLHAELAAAWLAKFHRTVLPGVETEPACERVKLFKLADCLAKGAAANPGDADLLLSLLQRVRELAPPPDARGPVAIVHGQFAPANIFATGTLATVIDLDRMCYSDPAIDVGAFLYRVRHHAARTGAFERGQALATSFEARYRDEAGENLVNLNFYRALFWLKGFSRFLKVPQPPGEAYERTKQFYLREFDESSRSVPAAGALVAGADAAGGWVR
jgi:hypothetical protein